MEDLKKEIIKWKENKEHILLMGDINEYVGSKNLKSFFNYLDMRELIREQHGMDGPAATRSNKSRQAINGIWGTLGIQIIAGGYLPFRHYI
eukprot:9448189-Ditylum_brightwellii.AAC.1